MPNSVPSKGRTERPEAAVGRRKGLFPNLDTKPAGKRETTAAGRKVLPFTRSHSAKERCQEEGDHQQQNWRHFDGPTQSTPTAGGWSERKD